MNNGEIFKIDDVHVSDDTVNTQLREVVPKKSEEKTKPKPEDLQLTADLSGESTPAEVSPTLGELRHTRERLKLDLGRSDSGGEDSGVGSSDKLDQVEETTGDGEKTDGVEEGKMESSGKIDHEEREPGSSGRGVKERDICSSEKSDGVEARKSGSLIKTDRVEERITGSSDKTNRLEGSTTGSSDTYRVEESKTWPPDVLDKIDNRLLRSPNNSDGVEVSKLDCLSILDHGRTDSGEDSGRGSSDKLDEVEAAVATTEA